MASQSAALQLILQAINAMREAGPGGYPGARLPRLGAPRGRRHSGPYAFGHCTECSRLIIGWSAYQ